MTLDELLSAAKYLSDSEKVKLIQGFVGDPGGSENSGPMTLDELLSAAKHLSDSEKVKLIQGFAAKSEENEKSVPSNSQKTEEKPSQERELNVQKNEEIKLNQEERLVNFTENPNEFIADRYIREYDTKMVPPSWLGFHRDGLITVFILDCCWIVIELLAFPLIPLLILLIGGISSYIVYSKQRVLGDQSSTALWKATLLGFIAAYPSPIFYGIFMMTVGVLNRILPPTKLVQAGNSRVSKYDLGNYLSEFKDIEDLISREAQRIDASRDPRKIDLEENIKFLREKGRMSHEIFESLNQLRKARNNFVHNKTINPSSNDQNFLMRCKNQIEEVFKGR